MWIKTVLLDPGTWAICGLPWSVFPLRATVSKEENNPFQCNLYVLHMHEGRFLSKW